jgi:hypothetical protein
MIVHYGLPGYAVVIIIKALYLEEYENLYTTGNIIIIIAAFIFIQSIIREIIYTIRAFKRLRKRYRELNTKVL